MWSYFKMSKVMLPDIRTQQLSLGNILSWGWSIYQKHFVNILIVTLIVTFPLNIALEVMPVPFAFANGILIFIFSVLEAMAIMFITERAVNNETMSIGDALRRAANRWARGIGTNILASIFIFFLLLLLIVPGIIWSVYYAFIVQVVALRNESGKSALDYSEVLVQGQWWRVVGTGFVLNLIPFCLSLGIEHSLGLLNTNLVINVIATTLVDIITGFTFVAITVLFLNLDYQKNIITPSSLDDPSNLSA